ncbi:MAG: hypothetical protein AB1716_01825 [Planctomycetota bacterium]
MDWDRMHVVGRTHLRRCIEQALLRADPELLLALFNILCCAEDPLAIAAPGDRYLLPVRGDLPTGGDAETGLAARSGQSKN